jgi:hypothetical protein
MNFPLTKRPRPIIGALTLLTLALFSSPAPAANELGLKAVWDQHLATPNDHPAVISACRAFATANPDDPLLPVAHGILAWHLFQEQKTDEAIRLLQPYLEPKQGPVNDGARLVAQGWLTRTLRPQVMAALQAYYRKEVGYPESLAAIAAHPRIPAADHPPLNDLFGQPWDYRLVGFNKVPGFENQKYELQSPTLGASSDLTTALKVPYADGINLVPVQVWDRNPPLVKFDTGAFPVGQNINGIHIAYAGRDLVIVCNHSYWKIYPRP